MPKRTDKTGRKAPSNDTYRRNDGQRDFEKGYQPVRGKLDTSNPPRDGSGVPSKSSGHIKKNRGD